MVGRLCKILAIDGGGIRGILPSMILAEVERRAGKPIHKLFDLIAGSSTGGLIAMSLTLPDPQGQVALTAEEVTLIYEHEGSRIFPRSMWRTVQSVGSITGSKYPSEGIDEVIDQIFGDAYLSDALGDVLITSYEIQRRQPWFFRSRKARLSPQCNWKVRDVVRATSAAPTYFEPAQVFHPDAEDYFALIDGSMQANNPSLCAYVEARDNYPQAQDFLMVSLGTGEQIRPIPFEEARQWGIAGWSQHLMDIMFDASSSTINYQLRRLIGTQRNGQARYYRFQASLAGANEQLDDATPKNIGALRAIGAKFIQDHDAELDQLVEQLLL